MASSQSGFTHKYPNAASNLGATAAAGDLIVASASESGGSGTFAVTGVTCTLTNRLVKSATGVFVTIYAGIVSGATGTPNLTYTPFGGDPGWSAVIFTGPNSATPHATGTATNASPLVPGAVSTTVVTCMYAVYGNETAGATNITGVSGGGTQLNSDTTHYDAAQYALDLAASSYQHGWTVGGASAADALAVAYFPVPSGGASVTYPQLERGMNRGANRGRNSGIARSIFLPSRELVIAAANDRLYRRAA